MLPGIEKSKYVYYSIKLHVTPRAAGRRIEPGDRMEA